MRLAEKLLPSGHRFRELWLPEHIVGTELPSAVVGGHASALTGALKGSTTQGLEMRGSERITITDHADISITDDLTVILPAFILPSIFSAASGADMGLMNLNNGAVIARLNSTTGALDFIFNNVDGGADETVSTTKVSWAADTLWEVGFTFENNGTGVVSVRLYINGVAENTNDQVDAVIVVPAGDTILGYDGTTYLTGKFQRKFVVYDTAVLTAAQMLFNYQGGIYATNLKAYIPLDHPGRGLSMPDRSTGGNCSGTISGTYTTLIWDYMGHPKLPVLSLDGINDYGLSSSGVDIDGDLTVLWVGKLRNIYDSIVAYWRLFYIRQNNNNRISLYYNANQTLAFYTIGSGTAKTINSGVTPAIDDYAIFIGTLTLAGASEMFYNGVSVGTETGTGVVSSAGFARAYLGSNHTPEEYDMSKAILVGLIDGVLDEKEARRLSRTLNDMLGLGLII